MSAPRRNRSAETVLKACRANDPSVVGPARVHTYPWVIDIMEKDATYTVQLSGLRADGIGPESTLGTDSRAKHLAIQF